MCELVWLKKRVGTKHKAKTKTPDVRLSTGKSNNSFNLTFSDGVVDRVSPSGRIDISVSGSRMYFRNGEDEASYTLAKGGHGKVNKYLNLPITTDAGRILYDWVKKYANGLGKFDLLKDEATGFYCIDANGNTTKEEN